MLCVSEGAAVDGLYRRRGAVCVAPRGALQALPEDPVARLCRCHLPHQGQKPGETICRLHCRPKIRMLLFYSTVVSIKVLEYSTVVLIRGCVI